MPKLCLVVEDDPLHRKIVEDVLEPFDFAIVEAENGVEAIEKCKQKM